MPFTVVKLAPPNRVIDLDPKDLVLDLDRTRVLGNGGSHGLFPPTEGLCLMHSVPKLGVTLAELFEDIGELIHTEVLA